MRIAGILNNDFTAFGVCTTIFVQGCPIHCPGCHNPETWDFAGGIEKDTLSLIQEVSQILNKNNINRDLCIQGGEPLCDENVFDVYTVVNNIKQLYPKIKIYIWSGYTYSQLLESKNPYVKKILSLSDMVIAGPYISAQRDITLHLRGSSNQEIIDLTKIK